MRYILFFASFLFVVGCMDQFEKTKDIPGPYILMESETNGWGLFYKLDNGNGIGRIMNVKQIGWTDKYIFASDGAKYFFLDKTRDNKFFNSNDIIKGPLLYNDYIKLLDSLNLKEFKFQMNLK